MWNCLGPKERSFWFLLNLFLCILFFSVEALEFTNFNHIHAYLKLDEMWKFHWCKNLKQLQRAQVVLQAFFWVRSSYSSHRTTIVINLRCRYKRKHTYKESELHHRRNGKSRMVLYFDIYFHVAWQFDCKFITFSTYLFIPIYFFNFMYLIIMNK